MIASSKVNYYCFNDFARMIIVAHPFRRGVIGSVEITMIRPLTADTIVSCRVTFPSFGDK
jgi:hypothetical protein